MNLPYDWIHCIDWGYGRLLFPWFGGGDFGRQVTTRRQFRLARSGRFHNCRVTGVI
jgi:hypothetical protein